MVFAVVALALAAQPSVAVLSSRGEVGELRFQPLGSAALAEPAVRFTHAEGSDVLGALLPKSRVVVATATLAARGDLSFASSLLRLEAGKSPRVLADQVVYGSRPLVTAEGRVFVARGTAGPRPADQERDALRVDALSVEEIDPSTGARRVVYGTQGYVTFLAGALGRELVIYEVTPARARLLLVHVDTLGVREVLPTMVPMARDFQVDAPRRRVLFTQADGDRWVVESVDLTTGTTKRLAEGDEVALLPTALADGRVLVSAGEGKGLRGLEGAAGLPAQGPGFERVRLEKGALLLGLHEVPGDFPRAFAFERGAPVRLETPPESRLDLAGVTP